MSRCKFKKFLDQNLKLTRALQVKKLEEKKKKKTYDEITLSTTCIMLDYDSHRLGLRLTSDVSVLSIELGSLCVASALSVWASSLSCTT